MTPVTVPEGVAGTRAAGVGGRMPVGWNRVKIEVADDSEKSRGGYDQIAFEFSGRHGSVRHWLVISDNPKSFPFIKRDLEACGVDFSNGTREVNAGAFKGRTIDVLIEHEDKPDKEDATKMRTFAVVKAMRKAEGEDPTPEHEGNSAGNGFQPQQPTGTAPPGPAYPNEDDIPF